MGIVHLEDHLTDVALYLGKTIPKNSPPHYGVEIELGWQDMSCRDEFFESLEQLRLDRAVVSKHDGSIEANAHSEIVTAPFDRDEIRKVVNSIGRLIESHAEKGLQTRGCGVHIHVSSEGLERDQVWRAFSAVCADGDASGSWEPGLVRDKKYAVSKKTFYEFLDTLALRGQGTYCRRMAHRNIRELVYYTQRHDRAIQFGRRTPTLELRILRTPKSRRVLESYLDFWESYLEFCKNPPKEYISTTVVPPDWEALGWPLRNIASPLTRRIRETYEQSGNEIVTRRHYTYVDETGRNFAQNERQRFYEGGIETFYPSREFLETNGLAIRPTSQHCGAVGWSGGVFPLREYTKFVLDNADRFSALAARLQLERFSKFVKAHSVLVADNTAPHLEYRSGCEVSCENYAGKYTVESVSLDEGTATLIGPDYPSGIVDYLSFLTHLCPGALEKGGES